MHCMEKLLLTRRWPCSTSCPSNSYQLCVAAVDHHCTHSMKFNNKVVTIFYYLFMVKVASIYWYTHFFKSAAIAWSAWASILIRKRNFFTLEAYPFCKPLFFFSSVNFHRLSLRSFVKLIWFRMRPTAKIISNMKNKLWLWKHRILCLFEGKNQNSISTQNEVSLAIFILGSTKIFQTWTKMCRKHNYFFSLVAWHLLFQNFPQRAICVAL